MPNNNEIRLTDKASFQKIGISYFGMGTFTNGTENSYGVIISLQKAQICEWAREDIMEWYYRSSIFSILFILFF
jgi:hypothetical protein